LCHRLLAGCESIAIEFEKQHADYEARVLRLTRRLAMLR
jgi:hypothetical protein